MALLFDNDSPDIPQTHALVIGVGGYRHLLGGVEEKGEIFPQSGILQQLTSPPRSALAFAEMLVESAAKLQSPLGTVDLLLSIAPGDDMFISPGQPLKTPNMANIKQAYREWRDRCDRHDDNIAIFYFCGHGLEKEEQILLAEDFGVDPDDPWDQAFALDSTRLAFQKYRAKTQCFFIDACREITSGMLTHDIRVRPLQPPDLTAPELATNLTIQGAARSLSSFGPPNEVAYFTQALILALQGAAAESPGNNRWVVNSNNVAAKIQEILGMVNPAEGFAQRASSRTTGNAALLEVGTPVVQLELACRPDQANEHARLTCSRIYPAGFPPAQHQGAPWLLKVEPGFYLATAQFDQGDYMNANAEVMALPPRQSPPLECGQ